MLLIIAKQTIFALTVGDLRGASATAVVIAYCSSADWSSIAEVLVANKSLR